VERLLDELAVNPGDRFLFAPLGGKSRSVAMTQIEFDPARLVLDLPNCQKCRGTMRLSRIEPDAPGFDKRTFECTQCENVVSEIVKYRDYGRSFPSEAAARAHADKFAQEIARRGLGPGRRGGAGFRDPSK
jgi:hypothetical protein